MPSEMSLLQEATPSSCMILKPCSPPISLQRDALRVPCPVGPLYLHVPARDTLQTAKIPYEVLRQLSQGHKRTLAGTCASWCFTLRLKEVVSHEPSYKLLSIADLLTNSSRRMGQVHSPRGLIRATGDSPKTGYALADPPDIFVNKRQILK